jgi:hypothetical protein
MTILFRPALQEGDPCTSYSTLPQPQLQALILKSRAPPSPRQPTTPEEYEEIV